MIPRKSTSDPPFMERHVQSQEYPDPFNIYLSNTKGDMLFFYFEKCKIG